MRTSGRSCSIVAHKVGTQGKTVIRCLRRNSYRSLPKRLVPDFPAIRVAPAIRGTQRSSTWKIEGQRHSLIAAIGFFDAINLSRDLDEIADARMVNRYALGFPGRAGGINDVKQLIFRLPFFFLSEARGGFTIDLWFRVVEKDLLNRKLGELLPKPGNRNNRLHVGVLLECKSMRSEGKLASSGT